MPRRTEDAAKVREIGAEIEKEIDLDDVPLEETAEESAEIALAEIQAEQDIHENKKETKDSDVRQIKEQSVKGDIPPIEQENIRAPNSFNLKEKEIFNKIPRELQDAIVRVERGREAHFTRTQQELQEKARNIQGIMEAIEPYRSIWAERGLTPSQVIGALMEAQRKLTDPALKTQAFLELAQDLGIDLNELASESVVETKKSDPYVKQLEAQILDLRQKIDPLYNQIWSESEARIRQATDRIIAELEAVAYEKDSTGNFVYPKLHEPEFLENWKPLVSALVRTTGSYTEAAKKAYSVLAGSNGHEFSQTKFPNINNKAISAAVSVRNKTAPIGAGSINESKDDKIPLNETAEESARIALQELMRR